MIPPITLTEDEIRAITGNLVQPSRQLAELHRRGFWRARLGVDHQVVLERAHYEAVCAGALQPSWQPGDTTTGPKLHPLKAT